MAMEARKTLLGLDPLQHHVAAEAFLASPSPASLESLLTSVRGEFPHQTILEMALGSLNLCLNEDSRALLAAWKRKHPDSGLVLEAWRAWLEQDPSLLDGAEDPAFAFPYRPETLPVLEWAAKESRASENGESSSKCSRR